MISNQINLLFLFFLTLIIAACGDPYRQEFSIRINGTMTSFIDTGDTRENATPFESSLENPIVSGTVLIENHLERQNHTGPGGYCCRKILLNTTENSTNIMSSPFVKLGVYTQRGENAIIHDYWAASISLPADHSPIALSLQVGNSTFIRSMVKLRDDIIVIPVYVHLFSGGANQIPYSTKQLAACFDLPNFTTSAVFEPNPNAPTVTPEELGYIFAPPDTIWKQAGIQFRLMSVNSINNAEFNRQIIGPSGLGSTLVSGYHAQNNLNVNGFHVYFGGNSQGLESQAQTTGPSSLCNANTIASRSNHIAMQFGATSYTLAHEIGHMLGLKHVDEADRNLACGGGLLGNSVLGGNLMKTRGFVNKLSPEQIAFARTVACKYQQLWSMPNTACTNP